MAVVARTYGVCWVIAGLNIGVGWTAATELAAAVMAVLRSLPMRSALFGWYHERTQMNVGLAVLCM